MKKLLSFLSSVKKELIIGTIILLFEPFIKWVWSLIFKLIINTNEFLGTIYYTLVAKNTPFNFIGDYLIISVYFFAVIFIVRRIQRRTKKIEALVNGVTEERNTNLPEIFKKYKSMSKMGLPIIIITGFILYSVHFSNIFVQAENNKFQRKIDIISPYVEDSEIKLLKSKWALMKSKSEYDQITNRINEVIYKEKLHE